MPPAFDAEALFDRISRGNVLAAECPSRLILQHVTSRWGSLVLLALMAGGTLRFAQLRRRIEGISERMLSLNLRTLTRSGLVARHVEPSVPPKVSYTLTPTGTELLAVMEGLTGWIARNLDTIEATRRYFETGGAPGCKAGLRFLVVTADGYLQPCSMQFKRYPLDQQARMVEEFTHHNTCDECYVAIRSNLDKSFPKLLKENVARYFSFASNSPGASGGGC